MQPSSFAEYPALLAYSSIFTQLQECREGLFYASAKLLKDPKKPFRPLHEPTVQEIEDDVKRRGWLTKNNQIIVNIICPPDYELKELSKEEKEKKILRDINGSALRNDDRVLSEQSDGVLLEVADGRHRFTTILRLIRKKFYDIHTSLLIPVEVYRNLSESQIARLTMCKKLIGRAPCSLDPVVEWSFVLTHLPVICILMESNIRLLSSLFRALFPGR